MIPALVAITPGDGRDLVPWLEALGAAGLPGVLLREPSLEPRWVAAAVQAVPVVWLHWRCRDPRRYGLPVHEQRQSCHSAAEVDQALASGAAWALLSPVWAPTSKPDDSRPPLGLERFLAVAAERPVIALGGVTPDRYAALRAHGASAAVLGDLFGQPDPVAASERLCRYLARP